ncbi:hypothetical protein PR202_ga11008 [Eleusine coracana subsp. coracana]|uniref:Uncharacterized protein n=1 Tax=Eleusine coracana subsp. coracana TaxID=191504 RepID=A0AAV5C7Z7_ELECO|nr:hypothetical protein PR202_ga11008 [Eleusine coracana subsp. coracana]
MHASHIAVFLETETERELDLLRSSVSFPAPNRRSRSRAAPRREEMKTFDPWPVFFRREWNRNWPFLTGFAITGYLICKMTANFTEEDLKNSKFVQEHKKH